jgi:hypothetical protein
MDTEKTIGIIIAIVSIIGGLGIGALAVYVGTMTATKEKIAEIEARNKERLALIEKGMDITVLDKKEYKKSNYAPLLWGLLIAGIGFGALTGNIISHITSMEHHFAIHCFALIFGGIGLIVYFIYKRKADSKGAE